MSKIVHADHTTRTLGQIVADLEEQLPSLRPIPGDPMPGMPGLDPPLRAVYSLMGTEGEWVQFEGPDDLSEDDLAAIRTILEA